LHLLVFAEICSCLGDALPGAAFGMDYGEVLAHGFLFKKSEFHSKARLSKGVWQQRWSKFSNQGGLRSHFLF
jgi:hypothetical protein